MNERIKSLFFLLKENEVVICESNLKDMLELLPKNLKGLRSYDYFYRQFNLSNRFEFEFDRTYIFQKKEYQAGKAVK